MISAELRKAIEQIPGSDGYWKSSTGEIFLKAAEKLHEIGMSDEDIVRMLSGLYWAAAECYGD